MSDELTEEQILERLREAGISPDQWGKMGGGGPKSPRFALRLAGDLQKVKALFEGILVEKQAEVGLLEERLIRLKHGGGS